MKSNYSISNPLTVTSFDHVLIRCTSYGCYVSHLVAACFFRIVFSATVNIVCRIFYCLYQKKTQQ